MQSIAELSKAAVATVVSIVFVFSCCECDIHHDPDHHHHRKQQQGIHDSKVVRDTEIKNKTVDVQIAWFFNSYRHISEHLEGQTNLNISQMTPDELEFYYFKLHDSDNNTKLDGLEIYKAMVHMLPYENTEHDSKHAKGKSFDEVQKEKKIHETKYYSEIVDNIMKADDINDDGYLTYPEFILARRREEAEEEEDRHRSTTKHH